MSGLAITEMKASDAKFEFEYLVKFKNMSYMHVQWLSAADIGNYNYIRYSEYVCMYDIYLLIFPYPLM